MKFCILLFFLLIRISAFGQVDSFFMKYTLLQTVPDQSVAVYTGNWNDFNPDSAAERNSFLELIMTFNNNRNTILLNTTDYIIKTLDSLALSLIKINNKKSAVYVVMKVKENSHLGEHGAYEAYKTIHEIYDLKSHKQLFAAVSKYEYRADYTEYYDSTSTYSTTAYFYRYDFSLSQESKISIGKTKTMLKVSEEGAAINTENSFPHYCDCLLPDHKEGMYVYRNGKYRYKNA
ncbi:MAG: hypothetical protein ACTHJT_15730, partial [Cytophaga sp.]|uniref:hypothetical protein n=1 Tax=Cytophaga sp. TaxID=29535 RepID=UPI003F8211E6